MPDELRKGPLQRSGIFGKVIIGAAIMLLIGVPASLFQGSTGYALFAAGWGAMLVVVAYIVHRKNW